MRAAVTALLLLLALPAAAQERVPWQPGNFSQFQMGWPAEGGRRAASGSLPVTLFLPPGPGPFPMVVLLHGCDGLRPQSWGRWVRPWTEALRAQGIGTAVVDSFAPRGVDQVCAANAGAWARRRADDAHSVRAWLAARSDVRADRIAVLGMSNGGRTVLAALRAPPRGTPPFRAGIALYPGCQSDGDARFVQPLLVLAGGADTVTPVAACEAMRDAQGAGGMVTLVTYAGALHSFDVDAPVREYLGMRLGGDATAAADARQRAVGFLLANGFGR